MKYSYRSVLALVAVLILAGCNGRRGESPIEQFVTWEDIRNQQTLIQLADGEDPVDLNRILASEEDLRTALDVVFPEVANIDNLGERIRRLQEPDGPSREFEAFQGLGGVMATALVDAAAATLTEDKFDPEKRVYVFVWGRIIDYKFRDPRLGGDSSGVFNTLTYFTRVTIRPGNTPIESETDAYRWSVSVDAGGFEVVPRDFSSATNPFPDTMMLSDAMLNRVDFLGFQFKLWAEGMTINIDSIERKAPGSSNFVMISTSDPRYRKTDSNCIDMMFVDYPAPELGTLKPPLYCLGRCKNPMLINTDAA